MLKINLNFLKAYWLVGQYLDNMFYLKPFDLDDVGLKMTKYLMFPNSHFYVKI